MKNPDKSKPISVIPPEAYPQMMRKSDAIQVSRILRSAVTAVKGAVAIAESSENLREAVYEYVAALEAAGQARDYPAIFAKAHEIRGFAETAGLLSAGRIAEGLCRYLGELERAGAAPDAMIVNLHVGAIARAARAEDETTRMGEAVAAELSSLVTRRLRDINKE